MFFRVATRDSSAVAIRLVTDRAAYPVENMKTRRRETTTHVLYGKLQSVVCFWLSVVLDDQHQNDDERIIAVKNTTLLE